MHAWDKQALADGIFDAPSDFGRGPTVNLVLYCHLAQIVPVQILQDATAIGESLVSLDPVAYRPYADPDDFIREVTDRIWVDRDIDHIVENYEPDSIVHVGLGTITTRDEVIEGSTMRMAESAANPGSQPAQAEDVVWEARGEDAFLSSHLILRAEPRAVNGRSHRVHVHSVANCLYRRGRMVEEWIAIDSLAAALQTRQNPSKLALTQTFRGYGGSFAGPPPSDVLSAGDSGPRADEFRAECVAVLELIEEVWNKRNFSRVRDLTIRDLFLHSVGEATFLRPAGYEQETLRLLAAFPNARFEVRDLQTNYSERYAGLRIAVMWKLVGRYEGQPHYGPVTDADVGLLGVSHFLVQNERIVRERRIYDDVALRSQINAMRGDESAASKNIYF